MGVVLFFFGPVREVIITRLLFFSPLQMTTEAENRDLKMNMSRVRIIRGKGGGGAREKLKEKEKS